MSKTLINTTASAVSVADTGVTISASGSYTITPVDYLLWAASSDVVTRVGAGTLVVNDGSVNLSISDGIDLIKGNFPKRAGLQDGIFNNITSTVVGATRGIDTAPTKYAPSTSASGSLTALNGVVGAASLDGFGTAGVVIAGSWVGTITFQGSVDGTTFIDTFVQPVGSGLIVQSTTGNGSFRLNTTGLVAVRVKMTGWASGTASVVMQLTPHAGFIRSLTNLVGGTDGTQVGNVDDRLKVDALSTVIMVSETAAAAAVLKSAEIAVATKTETDLAGVLYTVPAGKVFKLLAFNASYDTQAPMYVRLKKQIGGTGAFVTLYRITLKQHGQDESNAAISIPLGVNLGVAGDVFKVTYESALSRGTLWAGFTGVAF